MFLGSRERNIQTVRNLLVNYTSPTLVDSMDMTLEDISKLRQHHDIVEFFTDCLLRSNSPKTVSAPM